MPLTVEQKYTSAKLGVAVFGAALGSQVTAAYGDYLAAGNTPESAWNLVMQFAPAQELYPSALSNAQFAQKAVDNLLGNYVDITYKTWAVEQLTLFLQQGATRGDVLRVATDFVIGQPPNNVIWGEAGKALYSKVAVSNYYSSILNGDTLDVPSLRKIVAGVTNKTDVGTAESINKVLLQALEGTTPIALSLSPSLDALMGQAGDDTFTANITATSTELNAKDALDGRGGNDTLRIVDTSNTQFTLPTSLTLTSIERLDLTHSADDARQTMVLDFHAYTTLKDIKVAGTGTAVAADIALGGTATKLALSHMGLTTITDTSTGPSLLTRLDTSDMSGLVSLTSRASTLDVYMSKDLELRVTSPTTHTISVHADTLGTLSLDDKNISKLSIDNTGVASNAVVTLTTPTLTQLVLSGDFNAVLNTTGSSLTSLDATNATGVLKWTAPTLAASFSGKLGASGGVVDTSAAKGASTWKGGAGDDSIRVLNTQNNLIDAGAGNNTVTTGAGNDTITVGAGNSVINSGSGMDRITVGTGDHVYMQWLSTSHNVFPEITGFNQGDKLMLSTTAGATFNATALVGSGTVTFESMLALAAQGTTPRVSHFVFENNTYIVNDNSAATTFQDVGDQVLKLTGVVDMSHAVWDAGSSTLTL